jgi:hypothetical protein
MLQKNRYVNFMLLILLIGFYTGCSDKGSNITDSASPGPSIHSITPAEGSVGTELKISGSHFEPSTTVIIGGNAADDIEFSSSTTLYAKVPSGIAGNVPLNVTVENPDKKKATLDAAFTAIDPQLMFVNSATRPSGNIGSTIILEGKAFGDSQRDGQVLFSDGAGNTIPATIESPEDWTDTFIVTTVPNGADDGPVYVETEIGISGPVQFKVTDAAIFSPSSINWTQTIALPDSVSGHKALYTPIIDHNNQTQQFVFVTGGSNQNGEPVNQVLYGKIDLNGQITSWNSTALLSEPLSFHASVAATPFNSRISGSGAIYVIGGTDNSGEPVSTVSIGELQNDATISDWRGGRSLPEPLHSAGAVIFRSTIYVAGGATVNNEPVAKVYKAEIDTLGNLGEWEPLPSLPSARSYHSLLAFGGFLYTVGGESAAVSPDDGNSQNNDTKLSEIAYARIDLRTGNLHSSGWIINGSELQKKRSKHTAVTAGGTIFVSSGLYSAAAQGSSENMHAQINSDGSVGSFNGATGSNTLLSEGGNNLFNQSGISYVDENGVAHVMIIGGDHVNNPGTKTNNVFFY